MNCRRSTILFLFILSLLSQAVARSPELVYRGELHGLPDKIGQAGPFIAVAFDPDGSLFLVDRAGNRVIHAGGDGKYLSHAGGFGFGEGALRDPQDLCLVGFEVWVSDEIGGRIVRFDRRLAPLGTFAKTLGEQDRLPFDRPRSVAQALSGDIVIIEGERREALLFDSSGRLLGNVAGYGETSVPLQNPHRVEISPRTGMIAISDPGRRTILLYDRFGSPRGVRPFPLSGEGPFGVAWQGERLWLSGERGVVVVDVSGEIKASFPGEMFAGEVVHDVAVQGSILAVVAGSTLLIYEIRERR